ncbi:MAG: hypothetical protein Q8P24_08300 [Desulfobacterales bacterium]|nr:hypothetical protein [Desulfobacterales bacterium]
MKKTILILVMVGVAGLSFYIFEARAQMGSGSGMGSGMMGGGMMGGGMGQGMMDGGMMGQMCQGMMGGGYGPQHGSQYQQPPKPLDEKEAATLLENYLQSTRNPNLELGKIEDRGKDFEAEIQTKDGSLVNKILVDKNSRWMRSVY